MVCNMHDIHADPHLAPPYSTPFVMALLPLGKLGHLELPCIERLTV